jgi:peptidoglycan hydrolase-like protein with peptidoglycan-binding domain
MRGCHSPECTPYVDLGPALQEDGIFGPKTEAATLLFQSAQYPTEGSIDADGQVGPITHGKMDRLLAQQLC